MEHVKNTATAPRKVWTAPTVSVAPMMDAQSAIQTNVLDSNPNPYTYGS